MLVYRDASDAVATGDAIERLCAGVDAAVADDVLSLLIDAGEFEAAATDALCPDVDTADARTDTLRTVTLAAARAWRHTGTADPVALRSAIDDTRRLSLPATISIRVAEGYAYYAVFPQAYATAAERMLDDVETRDVVAIGIRSIGTSLSAVVAAVSEERGCRVETHTVRPRGHPFDRVVRTDARLVERWTRAADRGATFAIVDEGPGLSGSSFAAAAAAVAACGVPRERIVLLPGWDPRPEMLTSTAAQRLWRECRRYVSDAAQAGVTPERLFSVAEPTIDFSGGRWRAHVVPGPAWPAVQPQHERWKAFAPAAGRVFKFTGLGRYGRAARERAMRLASLGLGTVPGELRAGFLDLPFHQGIPLTEPPSTEECRAIGAFIGTIDREFRSSRRSDVAAVPLVIETNVRELLGNEAATALPDGDAMRRLLDAARPCAIDGRMLAHEWVRTAGGIVKVDALDHHADHFFPGVQDAAWDVAGALVELNPGGAGRRALVESFARAAGRRVSEREIALYRLAYAAFRAAYVAVAVDAVADRAERSRFEKDLRRYTSVLAGSLTAPNAP